MFYNIKVDIDRYIYPRSKSNFTIDTICIYSRKQQQVNSTKANNNVEYFRNNRDFKMS